MLKKLSDKKTYEGEEEANRSALEYLQEIRQIRDENTDLFKRIKRLPKKARSAKQCSSCVPLENLHNRDGCATLISFFRKGMLKKFYLAEANAEDVAELTFFDAVDVLKCDKDTERKHFQKDYYDLLSQNKLAFENSTAEDMEIAVTAGRGGKSNVDFIAKLLKTNEIKHFDGYTDEDEEYIQLARKAFQEGIIPQNTAKKIANAIKKEITKECLHSPLKILGILKQNIPDALLMPEQAGHGSQYHAKREVILSEYLGGGMKMKNINNCKQKELHDYIKFYRIYPQIVRTVSAQLQCIIPENVQETRILGTLSTLLRFSEKRKDRMIKKIHKKSFISHLNNDTKHTNSINSIPLKPLYDAKMSGVFLFLGGLHEI